MLLAVLCCVVLCCAVLCCVVFLQDSFQVTEDLHQNSSSEQQHQQHHQQQQQQQHSTQLQAPSTHQLAEHGLTSVAWSDCSFELPRLVVGGYSKVAVVWICEGGKWKQVSGRCVVCSSFSWLSHSVTYAIFYLSCV